MPTEKFADDERDEDLPTKIAIEPMMVISVWEGFFLTTCKYDGRFCEADLRDFLSRVFSPISCNFPVDFLHLFMMMRK